MFKKLLLIIFIITYVHAESRLKKYRQNRNLLKKLGRKVDTEYGSATPKLLPIKMLEKNDRNLAKLNRGISQYLFDGDMIVSKEFLEQLVNEQRRSNRQAYKDRFYPSTIWTKGVPYQFDPKLPREAVDSINHAMTFWQSETCVNFSPRKNENQYLFYTGAEDGCFSTVGRDTTQPKQAVNIGDGCYHFGVTSHEVAHALGVFHHQQRYDRDDHVTFFKDNIPSDYLPNFAKISPSFLTTYDTPYDVGSVMHYTPTEFANDHFKPALEAVDPNLQGTMGSMDKPSFLDVQLVNRHYNCSDLCAGMNTPACINGGYVNPRNCSQCKCPTGFGGPRCNLIESSAPMPCGGLLPASSTLQKLKITLRAGLDRKQCIYQIRAPKNRRVMIAVERVKGTCQEGCYSSGMEVKMVGDFRPVGYRFCCQAHSFRRLTSVSSAAPISFFAYNGTIEATIYYRWIVQTPDAEDTLSLTDAELSEIYVQKDGDSDLDMQVLSRKPVHQLNEENSVENYHDESSEFLGKIGTDGESDFDYSVYNV